MTVTLAHQKYPTNSRLPVKLSVANTSGKPCNRDMGAGQQEVMVKGTADNRLWSSDDCANDQSADKRTLQPNEKRTYWVTWESVTTAPNCGKPSSAVPGTYQVIGRIGSKWSAPVTVVLT